MGLIIRKVTGEAATRAHEIDDAEERIVFGRDADRCDVVFPADDTNVGREHFALERDLGRYRLVLREDHLVRVDGEAAEDGALLPEQCRIQLGPEGPELLVRTTGEDTLPPTVAQGHRPTAEQQVRDARVAGRRGRWVAVGTLVLLVVAAGLGYRALRRTESKAESAAHRLTNTLEDLAGMRGELHEIRGDLGEVRETAAAIETVDPARLERVERAMAESGPALRKALQSAAASVYLVLLQKDDGEEEGYGTAWVVAPGVLATNAHVANVRSRLLPGVRMVVRGTTPPHRDREVERVALHPAHEAFTALWRSYVPVVGADAQSARTIAAAGGAYDVALLYVRDEDARLGTPLPLASAEDLAALAPATPTGYVGFPMENMGLGGTPLREPTPQTQVGVLTAVTDYFGSSSTSSSAPADRHLLQHNCPATGGASGSPLLDARGRVVGVLSGGNVLLLLDTRVPSAVGVNYAQRADLVRELLEDQARGRQDGRVRRWRDRLETLYESGFLQQREGSLATACEHATGLVESGSSQLRTVTWTPIQRLEATTPSGSDAESGHVDWTIPRDGDYLLIALADRAAPLEAVLGLEMPDGGANDAPFVEFSPGVAMLLVSAQRSWSASLRATSSDALPLDVRFEIFRGDLAPMPTSRLREKLLVPWLGSLGPRYRAQQQGSARAEIPQDRFWPGQAPNQPPGRYLAVAVAPDGADVNLLVSVGDGSRRIGADTDPAHFAVVTFELSAPDDLAIRVLGPPGTEFELHLFRAVPAP